MKKYNQHYITAALLLAGLIISVIGLVLTGSGHTTDFISMTRAQLAWLVLTSAFAAASLFEGIQILYMRAQQEIAKSKHSPCEPNPECASNVIDCALAFEGSHKKLYHYNSGARTLTPVPPNKSTHIHKKFPDKAYNAPYLFPNEEDKETFKAFYDAIENGEPKGNCLVNLQPESHEEPAAYRMRFMALPHTGAAPAASVIIENVTEKREMQLLAQRARLDFHNVPEADLYAADISLEDDRFERESGTLFPKHTFNTENGFNAFAKSMIQLLHPYDKSKIRAILNREALLDACEEERLLFQYPLRFRSPEDTRYLWTSFILRLVRHPDGEDIEAYITIRNQDEHMRNTIQEKKSLQLDPLTQIYNRAGFRSAFAQILDNSTPDKEHALLILDLDNFKMINDTLGHQAGDDAIILTANTLSRAMRPGDIVGRLGGDEFIICLSNIPKGTDLTLRLESLTRMLRFTKSNIPVAASIGLAKWPRDGRTLNELYAKGDKALYHAKETGKSRWCAYELSMEDDQSNKQAIENKPLNA